MSCSKIKVDFFVLGAQKAGTTALHDMLVLHPEVALPVHKETHFFSHADRAEKGDAWYGEQFHISSGTKIIGEIDPEYMFAPKAAEAIRHHTSARKFVFLLRHPLKRAYSQYLMTRRRGYETLGFGAALRAEKQRMIGDNSLFAHNHWSYAARGIYSWQIEKFQRVHPDAEFMYLLSEDLKGTDATSGYARICHMIGTAPRDLGAVSRTRSNVASAPRSELLRNFIFAPNGKSKFRQGLMRMVPPDVKAAAFRFLDRVNRKPMDGNVEDALREAPVFVLQAMEEDLTRTEVLTGLDLSSWREDLVERRHRVHRSGQDAAEQ